MYLNTVTLIGFLGSDPDRRQTQNDHLFVVLSLATKASWKNKQTGEWESRTEWHRGIVFAPALADVSFRGTCVGLPNHDYFEVKMRRTEVRPIASRREISDLLIPEWNSL